MSTSFACYNFSANQVKSTAKQDRERESEGSATDSGTSLSSSGIVYSLFQAQFRSVVRCPVCHEESSSVEPFLLVPLPLPEVSLAVNATVVCSHPRQSVFQTSVTVSCSGTVKDLRRAIAADSNIPAEQACHVAVHETEEVVCNILN